MRIVNEADIPTQFEDTINSTAFALPCSAFNGLCSIYPERPSACSIYTCNLLESIQHNEIALEDALDIVLEIKNILNDILPILKNYTNEHTSNKPQYLIETILNNFKDELEKDEFKVKNKLLFMKCGIFYFLEDKYFQKHSSILKNMG